MNNLPRSPLHQSLPLMCRRGSQTFLPPIRQSRAGAVELMILTSWNATRSSAPSVIMATLLFISAVTATPPGTTRRVAVTRAKALLAARGSVVGPRLVAENLDLTSADELLQRRMLDRLRRDLAALSGAEMQGLATRQRNAQGSVSLIADGRHRSLSFDIVCGRWLWLSCLDFAAAL